MSDHNTRGITHFVLINEQLGTKSHFGTRVGGLRMPGHDACKWLMQSRSVSLGIEESRLAHVD